MLHFLDTRIQKGTFNKITQCLCLNGSYYENQNYENQNLTTKEERVDCPRCLKILEYAKQNNLSLKESQIIVINQE